MTSAHLLRPQIVAHRGYPKYYPENTLEGLQAAVDAGAKWLEFDIQLTRDGEPVLLHDASLLRTAGIELAIQNIGSAELKQLCVGEPQRFGNEFLESKVPLLADIAAWLGQHEGVHAFVELKRHSLSHHGRETTVRNVMRALQDIAQQCVIISFDAPVLEIAREHGVAAVGWAIKDLAQQTRQKAESIGPEYLFCGDLLVTDENTLWKGSWQWVVYEVSDPDWAQTLGDRGADFVETDAIGEMMSDARFKALSS